MVVLSNTAAQTLAAGQSLTFNVLKQTGCSEYIDGSGSSQVFLKPNGVYLVDFSTNVSSAAAATPVQLQLEMNGAPQAETLRVTTPAAADTLEPLSFATAVDTKANCCFSLGTVSLTVTNTGTNAITVDNPAFRIVRVG